MRMQIIREKANIKTLHQSVSHVIKDYVRKKARSKPHGCIWTLFYLGRKDERIYEEANGGCAA